VGGEGLEAVGCAAHVGLPIPFDEVEISIEGCVSDASGSVGTGNIERTLHLIHLDRYIEQTDP